MASVMVVDDHPGVAQAVSAMVRMSGCDVTVFDGGEAALRHLRAHRVDLVVLDVSMPRVSGLDVLREMAADGTLATTRVIMFSASEEHRAKSLALGAAAFVLKDQTDELIEKIAQSVQCGSLSPGTQNPPGEHPTQERH